MIDYDGLLSSITNFNKSKLLKTRKTTHELIVPFPRDQLSSTSNIPIINYLPSVTFHIKATNNEIKSFLISYEILSIIIHFLPFKDCFYSFSYLHEGIFITSIIVHIVRYSACVKGFLKKYINSIERKKELMERNDDSLDIHCPYLFCVFISFSGLSNVKRDLKNDENLMKMLQKYSTTRPEIGDLINVIEEER
ncbi:hypothetical protein ABK040_010386 [Willaertia magna]